MITIFLGEDTASSRKKYVAMRQEYSAKNSLVIDLTTENIGELSRHLLESASLFEDTKVFFAENMLSKKELREHLSIFDATASPADCVLWDDRVDPRSVKTYFKHARIVEAKLPHSIFTFLDSVYPGNKRGALGELREIQETVVENIVLYMLSGRIRELIFITHGDRPVKNYAPWQAAKLSEQAKKWNKSRILKFYEGLYRIEVASKTGSGYYSIHQALDILVSIYL